MRHDNPLDGNGNRVVGRVLLQTEVASADGDIQLAFPATPYNRFQVEIDNIAPSIGERFLICRFGIQGQFPVGANDFEFSVRTQRSDSSPAEHRSVNSTFIALCDQDNSVRMGDGAFQSGSWSIDIDPGNDTDSYPKLWFQGAYYSDNDNLMSPYGGGLYKGGTLGVEDRADAIQFQFDADTIARGTFRLYGTE